MGVLLIVALNVFQCCWSVLSDQIEAISITHLVWGDWKWSYMDVGREAARLTCSTLAEGLSDSKEGTKETKGKPRRTRRKSKQMDTSHIQNIFCKTVGICSRPESPNHCGRVSLRHNSVCLAEIFPAGKKCWSLIHSIHWSERSVARPNTAVDSSKAQSC